MHSFYKKVIWGRGKHDQPLQIVVVVSVAEVLGVETSPPSAQEGEKLHLLGSEHEAVCCSP